MRAVHILTGCSLAAAILAAIALLFNPYPFIGIAMPDAVRGDARNLFQRNRHVAVAIGAGKCDDGGAEGHADTRSTR